jgi:hypothetical protein
MVWPQALADVHGQAAIGRHVGACQRRLQRGVGDELKGNDEPQQQGHAGDHQQDEQKTPPPR